MLNAGHIIVTSSRDRTILVPGNVAYYCGTKHFVKVLLQSFNIETIQESDILPHLKRWGRMSPKGHLRYRDGSQKVVFGARMVRFGDGNECA